MQHMMLLKNESCWEFVFGTGLDWLRFKMFLDLASLAKTGEALPMQYLDSQQTLISKASRDKQIEDKNTPISWLWKSE